MIIPTLVVGYAVAAATIPSQHQGLLEAMRLLLVPIELCVVVYLVVLTRRALASAASGDGDFATRFRAAARKVLGSRIPADILTTEISILYYAFGSWRSQPRSPGSYTVHRQVGYLSVVIGLTMVLFVETVAVHLLVTQWSPIAAWILTGLSIYVVVWLVGDCRAMRLAHSASQRRTCCCAWACGGKLTSRVASIVHVDLLIPQNESPNRDTLVAALLGQANMRLKLTDPNEVIGMYGIRRTVQEIWLTIDGAAALCNDLRSADAVRD